MAAAERADPSKLAAELAAAGVLGVAGSYVDNSGIARVKTVPVGRLAHAAAHGIGMAPVFDVMLFDDSITSSPGSSGPVGDLRLFLDLERLTVLAALPGWAWAPVDRRAQDGQPHPGCQRAFARRMLLRAGERGLELRMGFELEWILYRRAGEEAALAVGGAGYGMDRLIEASDYCRELLATFAAQSLAIEQLHPEYAPAQFELSLVPADPLAAADLALLARHTVRAVTRRAGLDCSFAPSVAVDGVGNGCHLHVSLWRDGRTLMAGGRGPHGLVEEAEAFAAGLLDGLPALLAIGAPSAASYLRLQPQRWAAPYRCWGSENREAGLRLAAAGPHANLEVKCVDAAANPYLLVGAVAALGLDGIERGLRLPEEVAVDPATLPEGLVEPLPRRLDEALERFRGSAVLAEALGAPLFEAIVAVREAELKRFAGASPEEIVAATRFRY